MIIDLSINLHLSIDLECGGDRFQCQDGQCIPSNMECNGMFDCKDGSDEGNNCGVWRSVGIQPRVLPCCFPVWLQVFFHIVIASAERTRHIIGP